MNDLSIFVERLKELMIDKDINASELAEKLNMDKGSISKLLSACSAPSIETIIKMAEYFNCPVDFMVGLCDDYSDKEYKACPEFSERLKYMFEKSNKTKYAFKKQMKVSQSVLHNWLNGIHKPSIYNLMKLAKFFGCSVDYLLGRVDFD